MRETEGESSRITAEAIPTLDQIFDLLSNRHRRYALYHLHDQPDGVATIEEIAEYVVAHQHSDETATDESPSGRPGSDLGTETGSESESESESTLEQRRAQIRTELQHTHLPKLEDAGVVEYDHRSEAVRYWSQPSLEEWLEHADHKERP